MTKVNIIGLDPSLSNFGAARAVLDMDTMTFEITDLTLTETAPAAKAVKKVVRQNSQDLERAQELHGGMLKACHGARIAFVEVPVGSQSARAMASYGISVGVLAGCPIPMIQVTPTEVKLAGAGIKTATKDEMIEWAMKKYPGAPWLMHRGKPVAKNEHLADAVAAIEAGLKTDEFRRLVSLWKN